MRSTVITNCTNRKRAPVTVRLSDGQGERAEATPVCANWLARLAQAPSAGPVRDLYAGRSFREAQKAAEVTNARLMVVSAGLGLVAADTSAPSYSLTLKGPTTDAVLPRLTDGAIDWWRALQAASPYVADLEGQGLILAALSRPYLDMVAYNWSQWPAERLARLRLFSKEAPHHLPAAFMASWMPYDDRLDQLPGDHAGTQSDFAQRALRHFATRFGGQEGDAAAHAHAVANLMQAHTHGVRPNRARHPDAQIIALIDRDWAIVGGRSGAMLTHLRRTLDVACEQSRFKALFARAAQARAAKAS